MYTYHFLFYSRTKGLLHYYYAHNSLCLWIPINDMSQFYDYYGYCSNKNGSYLHNYIRKELQKECKDGCMESSNESKDHTMGTLVRQKKVALLRLCFPFFPLSYEVGISMSLGLSRLKNNFHISPITYNDIYTFHNVYINDIQCFMCMC